VLHEGGEGGVEDSLTRRGIVGGGLARFSPIS